MLNPAGSLQIQIDWDGQAVRQVAIVSTRPRAAQLLCGQTAQRAMALLPALYSICGRAQHCAGLAALAAARGQCAARPETALAIACEAAQEHLWRLLLDWPRLLDVEPLEQDFANWYRRLAAAAKLDTAAALRAQLRDLAGFVESSVLGMPVAAWLALDDAAAIQPGTCLAGDLWQALADERANAGEAVACLPSASAGEFAQVLAEESADAVPDDLAERGAAGWSEEFERHPTWRGLPAETGALARWRAQPLVAAQWAEHGGTVRTRLLARLMDLARCASYIGNDSDDTQEFAADALIDAHSPSPGVGIARVDTARGTLLHRLALQEHAGEQRVSAYAVVAPTEWNFHPRGAFAAAVYGLRSPSGDAAELRRQAERLAMVFDPCVAYSVEVRGA